MRQQAGEKHIVNTASIGGLLPLPGHLAYGTSKAAVAYLSETIAQELAPHGFGVTILCPGVVDTGLRDNSARLWGAAAGEAGQFEPVAMPMRERLQTLGVFTPEAVAAMVRNAILDNTLYLHTSAMPGDIVAERVNAVYGPRTLGRSM